MTGQTVIRFNRDGPEVTGLPFWGHLENENVTEGEPCTWHFPETTRKYYVIFDADAAGA